MSADPFDDPFASPEPAPAPAAAPASPLPTASKGPEVRRELRVKVNWPARVQLPTGQVVDLKARDIAENGLGLASPVPLAMGSVLAFALGSPHLDDPCKITPLTGTLKVVYVVMQRGDYQVGAVIQSMAEEQKDILGRWVRRLRKA